jgi:cytochrome c biogenesis protein
MNTGRSVWHFFASVKLALFLIGCIGIGAIIGTLIPQQQPAGWYAGVYGDQWARLILVLDIDTMYQAWWFNSLLLLLAINLIVCSIDRFPATWKIMRRDGLADGMKRFSGRTTGHHISTELSAGESVARTLSLLRTERYRPRSRETEQGVLIFAQKGPWTRCGVYIVHSSILVIFLGALIGTIGGFKGSILIGEGTAIERIVLRYTGELKPLDFAVRCNSFTIDFYDNGMPKEYTSNLTIIDDGGEVLTTDIEVNKPLTYKGITFYQASYEPSQDFIISVTNTETGESREFVTGFQQEVGWPEEDLSFGIINARAMGPTVVSAKLWFAGATPAAQWVDSGAVLDVKTDSGSYQASVRQRFSTGLQVVKDPGVWLVYGGFFLLVAGLCISFFMNHRRLWILVSSKTEHTTELIVTGSANKHRPAFETQLERLAHNLSNELT